MPPPFNLPPVRQQGRDYSVTPTFQSGPMQPRGAVESFDLTRNLSTGRSLVTGDRSLTRNPSGRADLPLAPMSEQIGSRGMTEQRRSEMAGRRLSSAMRAGDMQATALLYRGPTGYGRGFGQPPANDNPPPVQRPDSLMPPPAPAAPQAPAMPALPPPMSAEQALGMPGLTPPANDNPPPSLNMPWQGQPLPGFDTSMSLPHSTLMGGAGVPPPPDLEFRQLPGNPGYGVPVVRGEVQKQFLPMKNQTPPTFQMRQDATGAFRQFYGDEMLPGPTYSGQVVPGSYVRQATQGQPAPMQYTPDLPKATEKITEGPTGTTRTYTQPRGTQAVPPAGEGGSNYYDSLLPAAPTASTQTGQMPNTAYAAPLSPEQMLNEARSGYARTGNDAALRQYFAQYPSEAVRLNQQEQQIWQQIGNESAAFGQAANQKANAYDVRNTTLNAQMTPINPGGIVERYNQMVGVNPFTTGAKAVAYDAMFPERTRTINAPLPQMNFDLYNQANDLNRRAQLAAGRDPGPLMPQASAPPRPPLPLTPMLPTRRNTQGIGARFDRYFNS